LDSLAHLFLELGEIEKVRECYALLCGKYSKREDETSVQKVRGIAVRLAIIDKRYNDARRLTRARPEDVSNDPFTERRVYNLALIVAARLNSPDSGFANTVRLLEEAHLHARANARKAFPTFTLYRALVKTGRKRRANRMLNDYLTKHRREPWPPGTHLLESLPG
jgi:hypothetical protein